MDGPEKSETKVEDKGEPEEAAAEIEAGGRRKEIAENMKASTEKSRPFCIFGGMFLQVNCLCYFVLECDIIRKNRNGGIQMRNADGLATLAAALSNAMAIQAPMQAEPANERLCQFVDQALAGQKVSRIFMYNPDAIAQWIYQKYPHLFEEVKLRTQIEIPFATVMPSVTPVCFGTMYTGAQPDVHGIKGYVKPVIRIDTLFDALIRNGKKVALVSTAGDSMSKIFLERDMDYYIYDTVEEVNAKACELIIADDHDFIAVYNANYDTYMHKYGPESCEALGELRSNVRAFGMFAELIKAHWTKHNTLLGFAMDHGCHEIDGNCGSHGLDMDEDMNIVHLYGVLKASEHSEFEAYKAEAEEKWGGTQAYKEYGQKTKNFTKDQWNRLTADMDQIFAAFADCMKKGDAPEGEEPQHLVQKLQNFITEHYYHCTKQILFGLGQMYVADERFANNIDKHAVGTAQFVCRAITHFCKEI